MAYVEPSADIEAGVSLGEGTSVWHLAQVRTGAVVGQNCVVGRGAYIGPGVTIGDGCKLQNYALVYEPAILEDGVFVGPASVLTNDRFPRAIMPDGRAKCRADWGAVGVTVRRGASIGARAVCVAPVTIGAWALVAAGSVVVADVPDFGLVAGVPSRRHGWVGRLGVPLERVDEATWRCPQSEELYMEYDGALRLEKPFSSPTFTGQVTP